MMSISPTTMIQTQTLLKVRSTTFKTSKETLAFTMTLVHLRALSIDTHPLKKDRKKMAIYMSYATTFV